MIKAAVGLDLDPCGNQQRSKSKREPCPVVLTSRELSLLGVTEGKWAELNPGKLNQERAEQGDQKECRCCVHSENLVCPGLVIPSVVSNTF